MDLHPPLGQPVQPVGKQFFALFADKHVEAADCFGGLISFIGIDDFRFRHPKLNGAFQRFFKQIMIAKTQEPRFLVLSLFKAEFPHRALSELVGHVSNASATAPGVERKLRAT